MAGVFSSSTAAASIAIVTADFRSRADADHPDRASDIAAVAVPWSVRTSFAAADWIAFGPIFTTRSKREPDPVVGLERLRQLRGRTAKPLIAIGGVQRANVAEVLAAGADSVAVIQAVCSGDIARNCRELLAAAA